MNEEELDQIKKRYKDTSETLTEAFYDILRLTSLKDSKITVERPYASLSDCIWILAKVVKEMNERLSKLELK